MCVYTFVLCAFLCFMSGLKLFSLLLSLLSYSQRQCQEVTSHVGQFVATSPSTNHVSLIKSTLQVELTIAFFVCQANHKTGFVHREVT